MNNISYIATLKGLVLFPKKYIQLLLEQIKYKNIIIFPLALGLLFSFNKYFNLYGLTFTESTLGMLTAEIIVNLIGTIIICIIYSCVILFISYLLKGIANFKMTLASITYALIPMIIGYLVILILRLLLSFIFSNNLFILFFLIHFISISWSLYILILGNSFINQFSQLKSIFSCSLIIIISFLQLIATFKFH